MATNLDKWYEKAFDKDYLIRYSHRNEKQALSEIKWIEENIPLQKSWVILDACCGQGRHLRSWEERDYFPIGFDLSADLLAQTSSPVFRADQRYWPVKDRCIDLITVMFTSIGYFVDDTDNVLIFDEISRCLRPEGYFVIDTIDPHYLKKNIVPCTDKTLPTGRLVENRRFVDKRVVKEVNWHSKAGVKEYQESLRLFELEEYEKICEERNLKIEKTFTGFSDNAQGRLILIGRKK